MFFYIHGCRPLTGTCYSRCSPRYWPWSRSSCWSVLVKMHTKIMTLCCHGSKRLGLMFGMGLSKVSSFLTWSADLEMSVTSHRQEEWQLWMHGLTTWWGGSLRFRPRKCLTSYKLSSLEKIDRVLYAGGSSRQIAITRWCCSMSYFRWDRLVDAILRQAHCTTLVISVRCH